MEEPKIELLEKIKEVKEKNEEIVKVEEIKKTRVKTLRKDK